MNTQTILTSARVSCYREIPDYYNTKNLAIGPWRAGYYVADHPHAQYETESPTRDCYAHGYVIPGHTAASCADNCMDDVMAYFNACVHDALTGNW